MRYIKPILKVEEAEVVNMLAESLVIDGKTTVDGGDLVRRQGIIPYLNAKFNKEGLALI